MDTLFSKLWIIALREGKKLGEKPGDVFAPLGLYLVEPVSESWGYPDTPVNALTFGVTGVDGEHFSFLQKDGKLLDPSPVVMTVPTALEGYENIIVGEDLRDFLSLGYQVSFAALSALAYGERSRSELLADLVNRTPAWEGEEPEDDWIVAQKYLSRLLEKELDLKPWTAIESKLAILAERYFPLVQLQELNS